MLQWSDSARQFIAPVEHILSDRARQILAEETPDDRILIVDIDEASLDSAGPWPWPRYLVADLVERLLVDYGAKSVGLDIVFPSPSTDERGGDQRLAALGEHWPVVFAQAFDFAKREQPLQTGSPVFGRSQNQAGLSGQPMVATGFVANHQGLSQVRCVGNIGIRPDDDGRIRRVPLQVQWLGQSSQLLPLEMLNCVSGLGGAPTGAPIWGERPLLNAASWEIPFARKWAAYNVVSARDILSGAVPTDSFRGRWALIGSSALGLNDRASTPLTASTAGVMVHAAVLTSLLDWQSGQVPAWPVSGQWLATAWSVITLPLLVWLMRRFRAWIVLPATLALALSWLALAMWWLQNQLQFSIASPLLAYALVMLMIPFEWWLMQREQSHILRLFATYVAPTVVQQMLHEGIQHPLEPKYSEITVLSADMENYTGLTSQSSLEEAASLTREFLQCLTDPVLQQEGTLDKYTGDGLVAFWGAPVPCSDHTERAIEAGRNMVIGVRRWNEARVRLGLPPARVRVGIESGSVLVGDLGTEFRSTYTAVGDCINLASKLQAAARNKPTDLVIGPAAAARVSAARPGLVPLSMEKLPGKLQPVMLWTIQGLPPSSLAAVSTDQSELSPVS